jgi:hypothetical protein
MSDTPKLLSRDDFRPELHALAQAIANVYCDGDVERVWQEALGPDDTVDATPARQSESIVHLRAANPQ